jgi:hypothetical protein
LQATTALPLQAGAESGWQTRSAHAATAGLHQRLVVRQSMLVDERPSAAHVLREVPLHWLAEGVQIWGTQVASRQVSLA